MPWSDEQQFVIDDSTHSLLVSAAAGSGKTAVLVEKIKKLVLDGESIDRMLVVTFTNAAAAEMKDRLRKVLNDELSECKDENKIKLIKKQLSLIPFADICTYDSFAIKVLKNYYQVLDVNPDIKIIDDYKRVSFQKEAMDELIHSYYGKNDDDFNYLLDSYYSVKLGDRKLRDMIFAMYSFSVTLPDPEAFLENACFNPDTLFNLRVERIYNKLVFSKQCYEKLQHAYLNPIAEGLIPVPRRAGTCFENASIAENAIKYYENKDFDGMLSYLANAKLTTMPRANKEEAATVNLLSDLHEILHKEGGKKSFDEAKKMASNFSRELLQKDYELVGRNINLIAKLALEYKKIYENKKLTAKLMEFSDAEIYALKILENDAARTELRDHYEHIFVDEYQDSNLIQDSIISRIAREDKLFIVGDIKQSIYRFRHAEPKLFMERYKEYKFGQCEKAIAIDLNKNYRSKKTVIDFVNDVFTRMMTPQFVGMNYDTNAALNEGVEYTGNLLYNPQLYVVGMSDEDDVDDEIEAVKADECEALLVASIIKEYKGKHVHKKNKDEYIERELCYKDMTILLRQAKDHADVYYRVLSECGIPVYLSKNGGLFTAPESQVLFNLLRVIDNFKSDIPLISVLHFPSFGFSADELAQIRIFAKENKLLKCSFADAFIYYCENARTPLVEKAQAVLNQIKGWKLASTAMPLADFVWKVLSESCIIDFAAGFSDGEQRVSNLNLIVTKAEEYEQENGGGLFGFLSFIDVLTAKESNIKIGQSVSVNADDDVVTISTIHTSKGLQYPLVILASCNSRIDLIKQHERDHIFRSDIGCSLELVNAKLGTKTTPLSYEIIKDEEEKDRMAEELRLLYVAVTRAEEIFIAVGSDKRVNGLVGKTSLYEFSPSQCTSYAKMMLPSFKTGDVHLIPKQSLVKPFKEDVLHEKEEVLKMLMEGIAVDKTKLCLSEEELKSRLSFKYEANSSDAKRKYSVSEIAQKERESSGKYVLETSAAVPKFIGQSEKLNAAERGTAYHKLMEKLPFDFSEKTADYILDFSKKLVVQGILTQAEANSIEAEKICAFFESDIGKRACESQEIYKELPFTLRTEYNGQNVLVQGVIDCCFREGEEFVLVDYKSNRVDVKNTDSEKQRLISEYIPQLALYKEALEKIKNISVKEACLYLFETGDSINIKA